jgi:hypothetical protein
MMDSDLLCGICLDRITPADAFVLSSCGHSLHRPCLSVFSKDRSFRLESVKCYFGENDPKEVACGRCIIDDDLKLLLSEADWASVSRLRAQRADRSLRFCPRCPDQRVEGGSAAAPALKCPQCELEFCFVHATAHMGASCAEYESRVDIAQEAGLSETEINLTAKRCPDCSAWVERASGCNVINCASCGSSFCWLCLAKLPPGDEMPSHFQWWNVSGSRCANMQFAERPAVSSCDRFWWAISALLYGLVFGLPAIILVGTLWVICGLWACAPARNENGEQMSNSLMFLTLTSIVASVLATGAFAILATPFVLPVIIIYIATRPCRILARRWMERPPNATAESAPSAQSAGGSASPAIANAEIAPSAQSADGSASPAIGQEAVTVVVVAPADGAPP